MRTSRRSDRTKRAPTTVDWRHYVASSVVRRVDHVDDPANQAQGADQADKPDAVRPRLLLSAPGAQAGSEGRAASRHGPEQQQAEHDEADGRAGEATQLPVSRVRGLRCSKRSGWFVTDGMSGLRAGGFSADADEASARSTCLTSTAAGRGPASALA